MDADLQSRISRESANKTPKIAIKRWKSKARRKAGARVVGSPGDLLLWLASRISSKHWMKALKRLRDQI